jgi:thymidylate synthase
MNRTIEYLPFKDRKPDYQYKDLVKKVFEQGEESKVIHGEKAKYLQMQTMVFEMENGFPLITERDFGKGFRGASGEHIAFLNGARTLEELIHYGCPKIYWEKWVTKEKCEIFGLNEGDLGPGSYGPGWTHVPTPDGKFFNQIDNIQQQIKRAPFLRTHRIDPWIPYYASTSTQNYDFPRKVVVAPCHGWIRVFVNDETKTIDIGHTQRSADILVGLVSNIIQYADFGLMLSQTLGYKFRRLNYVIEDAHIYESQYDYVEELLSRDTNCFPTVTLPETKSRIEDYRKTDFILEDYYPGEKMVIPTPI